MENSLIMTRHHRYLLAALLLTTALLLTLWPATAQGFLPLPDGPFLESSANPVLTLTPGAWDSGYVARPSVLYENGVFHLFYVAQSFEGRGPFVGYASSTDGLTFTKHPEPVLVNEFYGCGTESIAALRDGSLWVLYITPHRCEGQNRLPGDVIVRAIAPQPTGPWSVSSVNDPALAAVNGSWVQRISVNSVVRRGEGDYLLYYTGLRDTNAPGTRNIGRAVSNDGLRFAPFTNGSLTSRFYDRSAPIFVEGQRGAWDDYGIRRASVIQIPSGGWAMFYQGRRAAIETEAEGSAEPPTVTGELPGIGYAASLDGLNWVPRDAPLLLSDERREVGYPSAVIVGNIVYLYYELTTDNRGIGLATGTLSQQTAPERGPRVRENLSLPRIELLEPESGVYSDLGVPDLNAAQIVLDWRPFGAALRYRVSAIVANDAPVVPVLAEAIVEGPPFAFRYSDLPATDAGAAYLLTVTGLDAFNAPVAEASVTITRETGIVATPRPPLGRIVITAPQPNTIFTDDDEDITVTWRPVTGALSYLIEVQPTDFGVNGSIVPTFTFPVAALIGTSAGLPYTITVTALNVLSDPIATGSVTIIRAVNEDNVIVDEGEPGGPTATPPPRSYCTISPDQRVNVRPTPSTSNPPRATLEPGLVYNVIGQAEGADGFIWWQVGPEQWVRADVVTPTGDCSLAPVTFP